MQQHRTRTRTGGHITWAAKSSSEMNAEAEKRVRRRGKSRFNLKLKMPPPPPLFCLLLGLFLCKQVLATSQISSTWVSAATSKPELRQHLAPQVTLAQVEETKPKVIHETKASNFTATKSPSAPNESPEKGIKLTNEIKFKNNNKKVDYFATKATVAIKSDGSKEFQSAASSLQPAIVSGDLIESEPHERQHELEGSISRRQQAERRSSSSGEERPRFRLAHIRPPPLPVGPNGNFSHEASSLDHLWSGSTSTNSASTSLMNQTQVPTNDQVQFDEDGQLAGSGQSKRANGKLNGQENSFKRRQENETNLSLSNFAPQHEDYHPILLDDQLEHISGHQLELDLPRINGTSNSTFKQAFDSSQLANQTQRRNQSDQISTFHYDTLPLDLDNLTTPKPLTDNQPRRQGSSSTTTTTTTLNKQQQAAAGFYYLPNADKWNRLDFDLPVEQNNNNNDGHKLNSFDGDVTSAGDGRGQSLRFISGQEHRDDEFKGAQRDSINWSPGRQQSSNNNRAAGRNAFDLSDQISGLSEQAFESERKFANRAKRKQQMELGEGIRVLQNGVSSASGDWQKSGLSYGFLPTAVNQQLASQDVPMQVVSFQQQQQRRPVVQQHASSQNLSPRLQQQNYAPTIAPFLLQANNNNQQPTYFNLIPLNEIPQTPRQQIPINRRMPQTRLRHHQTVQLGERAPTQHHRPSGSGKSILRSYRPMQLLNGNGKKSILSTINEKLNNWTGEHQQHQHQQQPDANVGKLIEQSFFDPAPIRPTTINGRLGNSYGPPAAPPLSTFMLSPQSIFFDPASVRQPTVAPAASSLNRFYGLTNNNLRHSHQQSANNLARRPQLGANAIQHQGSQQAASFIPVVALQVTRTSPAPALDRHGRQQQQQQQESQAAAPAPQMVALNNQDQEQEQVLQHQQHLIEATPANEIDDYLNSKTGQRPRSTNSNLNERQKWDDSPGGGYSLGLGLGGGGMSSPSMGSGRLATTGGKRAAHTTTTFRNRARPLGGYALDERPPSGSHETTVKSAVFGYLPHQADAPLLQAMQALQQLPTAPSGDQQQHQIPLTQSNNFNNLNLNANQQQQQQELYANLMDKSNRAVDAATPLLEHYPYGQMPAAAVTSNGDDMSQPSLALQLQAHNFAQNDIVHPFGSAGQLNPFGGLLANQNNHLQLVQQATGTLGQPTNSHSSHTQAQAFQQDPWTQFMLGGANPLLTNLHNNNQQQNQQSSLPSTLQQQLANLAHPQLAGTDQLMNPTFATPFFFPLGGGGGGQSGSLESFLDMMKTTPTNQQSNGGGEQTNEAQDDGKQSSGATDNNSEAAESTQLNNIKPTQSSHLNSVQNKGKKRSGEFFANAGQLLLSALPLLLAPTLGLMFAATSSSSPSNSAARYHATPNALGANNHNGLSHYAAGQELPLGLPEGLVSNASPTPQLFTPTPLVYNNNNNQDMTTTDLVGDSFGSDPNKNSKFDSNNNRHGSTATTINSTTSTTTTAAPKRRRRPNDEYKTSNVTASLPALTGFKLTGPSSKSAAAKTTTARPMTIILTSLAPQQPLSHHELNSSGSFSSIDLSSSASGGGGDNNQFQSFNLRNRSGLLSPPPTILVLEEDDESGNQQAANINNGNLTTTTTTTGEQNGNNNNNINSNDSYQLLFSNQHSSADEGHSLQRTTSNNLTTRSPNSISPNSSSTTTTATSSGTRTPQNYDVGYEGADFDAQFATLKRVVASSRAPQIVVLAADSAPSQPLPLPPPPTTMKPQRYIKDKNHYQYADVAQKPPSSELVALPEEYKQHNWLVTSGLLGNTTARRRLSSERVRTNQAPLPFTSESTNANADANANANANANVSALSSSNNDANQSNSSLLEGKLYPVSTWPAMRRRTVSVITSHGNKTLPDYSQRNSITSFASATNSEQTTSGNESPPPPPPTQQVHYDMLEAQDSNLSTLSQKQKNRYQQGRRNKLAGTSTSVQDDEEQMMNSSVGLGSATRIVQSTSAQVHVNTPLDEPEVVTSNLDSFLVDQQQQRGDQERRSGKTLRRRKRQLTLNEMQSEQQQQQAQEETAKTANRKKTKSLVGEKAARSRRVKIKKRKAALVSGAELQAIESATASHQYVDAEQLDKSTPNNNNNNNTSSSGSGSLLDVVPQVSSNEIELVDQHQQAAGVDVMRRDASKSKSAIVTAMITHVNNNGDDNDNDDATEDDRDQNGGNSRAQLDDTENYLATGRNRSLARLLRQQQQQQEPVEESELREQLLAKKLILDRIATRASANELGDEFQLGARGRMRPIALASGGGDGGGAGDDEVQLSRATKRRKMGQLNEATKRALAKFGTLLLEDTLQMPAPSPSIRKRTANRIRYGATSASTDYDELGGSATERYATRATQAPLMSPPPHQPGGGEGEGAAAGGGRGRQAPLSYDNWSQLYESRPPPPPPGSGNYSRYHAHETTLDERTRLTPPSPGGHGENSPTYSNPVRVGGARGNAEYFNSFNNNNNTSNPYELPIINDTYPSSRSSNKFPRPHTYNSDPLLSQSNPLSTPGGGGGRLAGGNGHSAYATETTLTPMADYNSRAPIKQEATISRYHDFLLSNRVPITSNGHNSTRQPYGLNGGEHQPPSSELMDARHSNYSTSTPNYQQASADSPHYSSDRHAHAHSYSDSLLAGRGRRPTMSEYNDFRDNNHENHYHNNNNNNNNNYSHYHPHNTSSSSYTNNGLQQPPSPPSHLAGWSRSSYPPLSQYGQNDHYSAYNQPRPSAPHSSSWSYSQGSSGGNGEGSRYSAPPQPHGYPTEPPAYGPHHHQQQSHFSSASNYNEPPLHHHHHHLQSSTYAPISSSSLMQHQHQQNQHYSHGPPPPPGNLYGGRDNAYEPAGRASDTKAVNEYLKRVQFSDSDRDKLMASYLTCDGLLNDNDHCLERLSCEFSDPQNIEKANKLDRAVSSILLGHILINTYIPNSFKLRLKSASLFGYTQSGKCSKFACSKLTARAGHLGSVQSD